MSWFWAIFLALVSLLLVLVLMRLMGKARSGWEAIGAALLLGIAGYGLQGSPGVPGAPKAPAEKITGDPQVAVAQRNALNGPAKMAGDNFVVIADALARHGQYADAAGVLLGAVDKDPKNADAWLALANALVGHAEGTLSPAALYAYRHASEAAPNSPGPPIFLGLALAQSGRLAEARAIWADLLQKAPADAPWRAGLQDKLAQLDTLIAQQSQAQGMAPPMP